MESVIAVRTEDPDKSDGYSVTSSVTSFSADTTVSSWVSLQRYSLAHLLLTSLVLGAIILATVVGNVFVIAAIVLERNLRNVANYLIASLAVADLLVAALVMPLAAVNEVSSRWFLGAGWCDAWTSFDVLCCTSSILHLVAISLDRYWAVTRVDYIHNRSASRIWLMVGLSWALSAVISVPPLFGAGDPQRDPDTTGICTINHNRGYAVFSTVCAFYLPLLAMMIIYARVYRAARSRIRKQQFQRGHGCHGRNARNAAAIQLTEYTSTTVMDTPPTPRRPGDPSTIELVVRTTSSGDGPVEVHPVVEEPAPTSQRVKIRRAVEKINIVKLFASRSGVSLTASANCSSPRIDGPRSSSSVVETPFSPAASTPLPDETGNGSPGRHFKSLLRTPTTTMNNEQMSLLAASAAGREKQKQKRERKAARTLAIVTGTFVVCWLPFFIVELVQPFCGDAMAGYPEVLASVIVWLGYVNSLLNPVIYTIFNPDFRSAFRKILFGRCDRQRNQ